MPVNFTDSPSNGDTVTSGGFVYTYDSTNARWKSSAGTSFNTEEVQDVAGAMFTGNTETGITATYQDSDGTVDLVVPVASGTAVYATFALLVAATGMSTGDLAYVTATNKLYLYSVNGWFLVATVSNASPTAITGVSSAYDLATDATATVITAVSTDPEGFALTWSYAVTTGSLTNGGGVSATVSQSANVFTITPTTNSSYAGTFSITFTVTDGVNGAVNAVGAFTLTFSVDWTSVTQEATLEASDAAANDAIGYEVGLDGNTGIVGAYSGAGAYIFTRSGTTWSQQQKLEGDDNTDAAAQFGGTVAISGDTVVVGAERDDIGGDRVGQAYVFTRSGTTWSLQQKLTHPTDSADGQRYAAGVAIDGETLAVSTNGVDSYTGEISIYTRSGTTWSHQQTIQHSNRANGDYFGNFQGLAIDGDNLIAGAERQDTGASNAGAAFIFTRSGTTWTEQQKIQASDKEASDNFGHSVAIDGDSVIVGAQGEDTGANNAGAAYIFTRSGTTWSQQQKIQASDASSYTSATFGYSVTIKGDYAAAGAVWRGPSSRGAVYVYTRSGTTWSQSKQVLASDTGDDDNFGASVSMSGDTILVGAYGWDNSSGASCGAAYALVGG